MALSWGGVRQGQSLGLDLVEQSRSGGTVTMRCRFWHRSTYPMIDTTNTLSWSGSASGSKSPGINRGSAWTGESQLHEVTFNVSLAPGESNTVTVNAAVGPLEVIPGADKSISHSVSVTVSRAADPPAPATGVTATRVDDTKATVAWTKHATSDAPYTGQGIDRTEDDWTSFVLASGWLGSAPSSWQDTSLQPNRRYHYRHVATNSGGTSSHAYAAAAVYTTPAATTAPTVAKLTTGMVRLRWAIGARHGSSQEIQTQTSADGGASWSGWSTIKSGLSPSATEWTTEVAPDPGLLHRYRTRTLVPSGGLVGISVASPVIQVAAPPAKPTNLATLAVVGETIVLSCQHSPVDGSPISAIAFEHRQTSSDPWTSVPKTAVSVAARTLPAGTYTADFEWRVQTWGEHPDGSPWSDPVTVRVRPRPTAAITSPTSSALGASRVTAVGSYFSAASTPMAGWRWRLYHGVVLVREVNGTVAQIRATFTGLADGESYELRLDVRDADNLWSAVTVQALDVTYEPPATPTLTVTFDPSDASAIIQVTNPASGVAVIRNEIWSGGRMVGEVGPNGALTHRIPDLDGTQTYLVQAISELPSSADSTAVPLVIDEEVGCHLNGGAGWGLHAAMWRGSPSIDISEAVDVSLTTWGLDELPSPDFGPALPESLTVSGTLWHDRPGSSRSHFEAIRRARTTVCYRDCLQTVYGVLTSLSWGITSGRYAQLTLAITPTMVDEADLVDRQVLLVEDPPGSGEWRIVGVTGEVSIFDLIGG